ncbi:hypothetical protein ABID23_000571 [Bartonella silvatica]|uniref:Uncharacterized protein n=1 Tax=Bartonella silvatica TaxID=357760 RepID=A0ABV2HG29_9HYPH
MVFPIMRCMRINFQGDGVEIMPFLGGLYSRYLQNREKKSLFLEQIGIFDYNSLLDQKKSIYFKVKRQIVAEYII